MLEEIRYLTIPDGAYARGLYTNNRYGSYDMITLQDLYYVMKAKAMDKPDNYVELYAVLNAYAAYQTGGSLRYKMTDYTKLSNNFKVNLSFLENKYKRKFNLLKIISEKFESIDDFYVFEEAKVPLEDAVLQMAKHSGKLPINGKNYDTQFYRLYYFIVKKHGQSQVIVADGRMPLFIYSKNHICRCYTDETAREMHERQLSSLISVMEHKLGYDYKTGNEFKLVGSKYKRPMTFNLYLGSELPIKSSGMSGTSFIDMMGGIELRTTDSPAFYKTYDTIMFLEDLAQLL